jgi:DNA-binding winged helix-turn-helix (wHTH) protein
LATGADDYIVKPFSVPELVARVQALLRRAAPEKVADILSFGDLAMDRSTRRVSRAGRAVELGPTEYRLLEHLVERPGRVLSREQLLDGVWGHDVYIDERTVDVHIGRLRRALKQDGKIDPIRTVRGAGYALNDRFARSAAYELFEQAMRTRKQICCMYDGYPRELCPVILGHSQGQEKALTYQFGGKSNSGLGPEGDWRCLWLSKVSDVQLRDGPWRVGTRHTQPHRCVDDVDLDVNPASPYHPRRLVDEV